MSEWVCGRFDPDYVDRKEITKPPERSVEELEAELEARLEQYLGEMVH